MCAVIILLILLIYLTFAGIRVNNRNTEFMSYDSTDFIRGACILGIALHHTYKFGYALGAFGSLGTAVFFALSGYGNYFSLERNRGGYKWICKRLIRILLPFIIIWSAYMLVLAFTNNDLVTGKNIGWYMKELLSVTIPPWTTWFLKTQLVVYLVNFFIFVIFKVIGKSNISAYFLMIVTLIYTVVLIIMKVPDFWWSSVICYSVGQIVAINKEKVKNVSTLKNVTTLGLITFIFYAMTTFVSGYAAIVTNIVGSLFVILATGYFTMDSKVLKSVGKMSLEFYLVQLCLMHLVMNTLTTNDNIKVLIYSALTLIIGFVSHQVVEGINSKLKN